MPDDGRAEKLAPMRVLIVDNDEALRESAQRLMRRAGIETASAASVGQAIERLRSEPFDAVMCDLRMPGGDGGTLVQWVGSYSPSMRILVASAHISDEFREQHGQNPQLRMMDKPLDLDAAIEVFREFGPRRGFYGNSIEVELFDYVQMIALTGRDKLIEVGTPRGSGQIWFEHGDIVHAEYDQYRGELAFYKMLSVGRGSFREVIGSEPPMRTVTRSSTHLLMEAARQTDEGILGEGDPDAEIDEETSFGDLIDDPTTRPIVVDDSAAVPEALLDGTDTPPRTPTGPHPPVVAAESAPAMASVSIRATSEHEDEDFAALVNDAIELELSPPPVEDLGPADSMVSAPRPSLDPADSQSGAGPSGGHAIFEDPDTRAAMLDQFWQFDGINGVAIISSTGKVLAEDMRSNSSLVTLAGFYMRGAARIARTLGYNVFDGVVARSVNGQQMVMVSMGAASAVLSVEAGADPEAVRDAVMGVE